MGKWHCDNHKTSDILKKLITNRKTKVIYLHCTNLRNSWIYIKGMLYKNEKTLT